MQAVWRTQVYALPHRIALFLQSLNTNGHSSIWLCHIHVLMTCRGKVPV